MSKKHQILTWSVWLLDQMKGDHGEPEQLPDVQYLRLPDLTLECDQPYWRTSLGGDIDRPVPHLARLRNASLALGWLIQVVAAQYPKWLAANRPAVRTILPRPARTQRDVNVARQTAIWLLAVPENNVGL